MADRSFRAAVLVGPAGAALAAAAAAQEWATARGRVAGGPVTAAVSGADAAPLALALSLVALAGWGALLVLRGLARRAVALLALLAAGGVVVAVAVGHGAARSAARAEVTGSADGVVTALTGWYWATGAGAGLTLVALAVAVVRAPRWPAMGSRYDAPAARRADDTDLWRALDEGRDPTE